MCLNGVLWWSNKTCLRLGVSGQVQFEKDARKRFLQLLGYDHTELSKKVAEMTGADALGKKSGVSPDELADKMNMLNAVSTFLVHLLGRWVRCDRVDKMKILVGFVGCKFRFWSCGPRKLSGH